MRGSDQPGDAVTVVSPRDPIGRTVRADDMVTFLECARLEGDLAQAPAGCAAASSEIAAIPRQGALPSVAAAGGVPTTLSPDRLVVLAPSIGDAGRPPTAQQLEALRIYRKLEREDAKGLIARAVEAYRSQTGVRDVKGAELRRYVVRSASQTQTAAYLDDTRNLLTQLRLSRMETPDLERASLWILEQISPANLPPRELEAAALSPGS